MTLISDFAEQPTHVPRRVLLAHEEDGSFFEAALDELRTLPAYVLLGDPGSGKTATFRHEALHTPEGHYLRAIDIQSLTTLPADAVLYIDALDEARAGMSDAFEPLVSLQRRLRDLGVHRFRIACREADWFGQADQQAFASLLPAGELTIAQLLPLNDAEVAALLTSVGEPNPQGFIAQAHAYRLEGLLRNPMSLRLLQRALQHGQPTSREQLYRLACDELVREANPEHRVRSSRQRPKFETLIKAASELCAWMLLSGKAAVSLQADPQGNDVVEFDALPETEPMAAAIQRLALGTRLFASRAGSPATVEPLHRTVAEYLAARHLSALLDAGLPPQRLTALLGCGGQVVTSLRGLNAWLASVNAPHRRRFIAADPLGVALYGDASDYGTEDKQFVIECLAAEARKSPHFRMGQWHQAPDAALASEDMASYFRAILTASTRTPEHLALIELVIDSLASAKRLIGLEDVVLNLMCSTDLPDPLRDAAMNAWLASDPHEEMARPILTRLRASIPAPAAMLGRLVRHFHPSALTMAEALRYLPPSSADDPDAWQYRWGRHVAKHTTDDALEAAVEALLEHGHRTDDGPRAHGHDGSPELLSRLLTLKGEAASPEKLCRWLSLGLSTARGHILHQWRSTEALKDIQAWLKAHPGSYRAALAHLIEATPFDDEARAERWLKSLTTRLLAADWPSDLGRWYLLQARDCRHPALIKHALSVAARCFFHNHANEGLSLEYLEKWRDEISQRHPAVARWFQDMFVCDAEEMAHHRDDFAHVQARRQRRLAAISSWKDRTLREATALPAGLASTALLNELAQVWNGRFHDVQGDSGEQRLSEFFGGDVDLVALALSGLSLAHLRDDLPTVDDILAIELQGQRHTIADTCLLGAELQCSQCADAHATWTEDLVARLLAFYLTRGTGPDPVWFGPMLDARPDCVASVYTDFVLGRLRAGQSHVFLAHRLTEDDAFTPIAARIVLPILQAWPSRCVADQRPTLLQFHDAAWAFVLPIDLDALAIDRLRLRSLDAVQRTHWRLVQAVRDESLTTMQHLVDTALASTLSHETLLDLAAMPGMRTQLEQLPLQHQSIFWRALAAPIAPARWPRDAVSGWLHALASNPSEQATKVLQAWLADPALHAWRTHLRALLYQQQAAYRDAHHPLPSIREVAATLANRGPSNHADLCAIMLDALDELSKELRGGNAAYGQNFWRTKVVKRQEQDEPKVENECRDQIKQYLEPRLNSLRITVDKEAAKVDDSRCDLQVSFRTSGGRRMLVPVEIKRAGHSALWTAMQSQLIDRYATDPAADGHGIYLVLWFGAHKSRLERHPQWLPVLQAADLQRLLAETVPATLRQHIHVVVLDVSPHARGRPH